MALGKRSSHHQEDLFLAASELPRSPGHPFYKRLNDVLREAKFDKQVEELCEPFYSSRGRRSIPPGVYVRMLLIGYFEGISSQRGIAWRCSDSRSLQEFLGMKASQRTPDHSSMTVIRKRLSLEVHQDIFTMVLEMASAKGLLKGKTIAVDSTMLEANAAMKSIVRRDTKDSWKAYIKKLAEEEGIEDPSDDDLRRFDQKRKDKKVSNKDWSSKSDPDSRIAKMKDGRTHLAYKAEHAIDIDTEIIIAAEIYPADRADSEAIKSTMCEVAGAFEELGQEPCSEVVADKGYHKTESLVWFEERGVRTYIPEKRSARQRKWTDKPEGYEQAYRENRRRVERDKSKSLQKKRSERVERSFAHVCGSGAARRTWIRGRVEISKRYLIQVAARNLGTIMRKLIGAGTPRGFREAMKGLIIAFSRPLKVAGYRVALILRFVVRLSAINAASHHLAKQVPLAA